MWPGVADAVPATPALPANIVNGLTGSSLIAGLQDQARSGVAQQAQSAINVAASLAKGATDATGYPFHDSIWDRDTRSYPVAANSAAISANFNSQISGNVHLNSEQYNSSLKFANPSTPRRKLNFHCEDGRPQPFNWDDWTKDVPIDPSWQAAKGTDGELSVVEVDAMGVPTKLYSMWQYANGSACHGGVMNLQGNNEGVPRGVFPEWGGATASSLAIAGGSISPSEARSGNIPHALYIALPKTRANQFSCPATRTDGFVDDPSTFMEGQRGRLDVSDAEMASLKLGPFAKSVVNTLRTRGFIVSDKSAMTPILSTIKDDKFWGDFTAKPENSLDGIPWDKIVALKPNVDPECQHLGDKTLTFSDVKEGAIPGLNPDAAPSSTPSSSTTPTVPGQAPTDTPSVPVSPGDPSTAPAVAVPTTPAEPLDDDAGDGPVPTGPLGPTPDPAATAMPSVQALPPDQSTPPGVAQQSAPAGQG